MTGFCVAIHQVYRDRSEGLAWGKAVSRYKFCIMTEVVEWLGFCITMHYSVL